MTGFFISCTHPICPPLYYVKRGKCHIYNRLSPLFASAERGMGGEFVKKKEKKVYLYE
jgi:hypothetical protein